MVRRLVLVACLGLLFGAITWKAWVTDDAYITFRAVENLVQGRGPNWNVGERVQVFTHPLWMLLMAGVRQFANEYFYSSIVLGIVLTLGALLLVRVRLAPPLPTACAVVAVLAASRAFTDYSTSGLENALTHFCLAGLFILDFQGGRRFVHHCLFFLAASACLLCRMDTIFLLLPVLVLHLVRHRHPRLLGAAALGFLPLLGWEAFSVLYYGFFLPNSASAKLNSGVGTASLVAQGLRYLSNSLRWDFVTLVATLAGTGLALRSGDSRIRAWGIGVFLSLLYVVRVGGDFMSGRFLTAPLWVAALLLLRLGLQPRAAWVVTAASLLLLFIPYFSPFAERQYGREWYAAIDAHGIADERTYYDEASLRRILAQHGPPRADMRKHAKALTSAWPEDPLMDSLRVWVLDPREDWPPRSRRQPSGAEYKRVVLRGAVGYVGFYLGADTHVIDYHGIGDPLLARLPALVPDPVLAGLIPPLAGLGWRIGHFTRAIPAGYVQTLATGRNQIQDPSLRAYYDKLSLVTRGPLLDRERLRTIWHFQRGEYDHLLRVYRGFRG